MTPITYGRASMRSVWTATLWFCPRTRTASPAWRFCLSDGTAEATETLLYPLCCWWSSFPTTEHWGIPCCSGFWGAGPIMGINVTMFLLQQTYKQFVRLSGQNETVHWTEGLKCKDFLYSCIFQLSSQSIGSKSPEKGCESLNMLQTSIAGPLKTFAFQLVMKEV